MSIGTIVSIILILFGGVIYLALNGRYPIHYQTFQQPTPQLTTYKGVWNNLLSSPLAWIQCGLLMLVVLQIVRVALTAWLFIKIKDVYFAMISLFILAVLVFAFF